MARLGYVTHHLHSGLTIPDNIDLVIHSGDESNNKDPILNKMECLDFLGWYKNLPIGVKIFTPGNHSTAIEAKYITRKYIESLGIIYLENESVEVLGLKVFGSPYTPKYNDWAFNRDRAKMHKVWDKVPLDTDIIISHGPPKGILDLSTDRKNILEQCGDSNLLKCIERVKPRLVAFGHLHNNRVCYNTGTLRLPQFPDTLFSNACCVEDGKLMKISSHGNIIEL